MAVEYEDGAIIGADSRTSKGIYVANRVSDKLTKITDRIYCCRSGSKADTQAITNIVAYSLNYHENQTGEEPLVWDAACEVRNYCYNYRNNLMAAIIVAGWDKVKGGQVYSIPLGGMLIRQPYAIGGSGSTYIYGLVKELYRPDMKKEECIDFVKKCRFSGLNIVNEFCFNGYFSYFLFYAAILQAIHVDGSSGGVVRIGIITADGIERRTFYNTENGKIIKEYEG